MRRSLGKLGMTCIQERLYEKVIYFIYLYIYSKNLIWKFNKFCDDSDIDEQKVFMMMLSVAVAGLRNPRAHKIIKDDPEMALEFIAYISLLAKLVDKSTK